MFTGEVSSGFCNCYPDEGVSSEVDVSDAMAVSDGGDAPADARLETSDFDAGEVLEGSDRGAADAPVERLDDAVIDRSDGGD
jgi:hypothetical protein